MICRAAHTSTILCALGLLIFSTGLASSQRLDGFNVIVASGHPFGSPSARRSLALAKALGAKAVAVVPFLWQAKPDDPHVRRGADMSDMELRDAVRQARALGFYVIVKPQVWVPESWAGAVAMRSNEDWQHWFAAYRSAILHIAKIALEENADALALGTELAQTTDRAEWLDMIAAARAIFPSMLFYVAHNIDEARAVSFWGQLDAIGVSLYPKLGADEARTERLVIMHTVADALDELAARSGKPVIVGEIGLRSAEGAAAKPWESAEERPAASKPALQAEVLGDWLRILRRPAIKGVLIWRWFTDPAAGGMTDTDFTVQGKPAEAVLLCAWTAQCAKR